MSPRDLLFLAEAATLEQRIHFFVGNFDFLRILKRNFSTNVSSRDLPSQVLLKFAVFSQLHAAQQEHTFFILY